MKKSRLEAFSDGVLAIVITIMVLELRPPESTDWHSVLSIAPIFVSYVVSFIYIGIYWNNHHHLFQMVEKVNGRILWANLHLLFWLSLIPFTTSWIGEHFEQSLPVFAYGIVLLMCAFAYFILQSSIIHFHGKEFELRKAIGKDFKGKLSIAVYIVGILSSMFYIWLALICYISVAIIWFIPDKRIENSL